MVRSKQGIRGCIHYLYNFPDIKDQMECANCSVFHSIVILEFINCLLHKPLSHHVSLSIWVLVLMLAF